MATCTICRHDSRHAIEKSIIDGVPNRRLAATYQVSQISIRRHKANHLATLTVMQQQHQFLMTLAEKLQNVQQIALFEQAVLDAIAEVAPNVRAAIEDRLRRRQPLRRLSGPPLR